MKSDNVIIGFIAAGLLLAGGYAVLNHNAQVKANNAGGGGTGGGGTGGGGTGGGGTGGNGDHINGGGNGGTAHAYSYHGYSLKLNDAHGGGQWQGDSETQSVLDSYLADPSQHTSKYTDLNNLGTWTPKLPIPTFVPWTGGD